MPPKKGATETKQKLKRKQEDKSLPPNNVQEQANSSKKRANDATTSTSNKAPRRSGRGDAKSHPSQQQLLNYMLSQAAEELCRPGDESEDIRNRKNIKTYSSSVLNPFEELLCAAILSRPISHRLGLRTIRTVLNDPYNFTSAKAIIDAGDEKVHEAIWTAKTQHKQKTAEEISRLADVVLENFTAAGDKEGTKLGKVLDNDGDVDETLDELKQSVKGLGATALNIFQRRVQWRWTAAYPFVDDRTSQSLKKLNLPEDADKLAKALDEHWNKLDTKNLAGSSEGEKKRRALVVLLERAIGADLEGKIDDLLNAAK